MQTKDIQMLHHWNTIPRDDQQYMNNALINLCDRLSAQVDILLAVVDKQEKRLMLIENSPMAYAPDAEQSMVAPEDEILNALKPEYLEDPDE